MNRSMRVFREFIRRTHNRDGVDYIDASGVISRECYDLWVSTRKQLPPNPEKAFQRSLSAHVTGVDGRVPFTQAAVLRVLRRKERWPCFEQSSTRFGLMGFRAKGYHEKSGDAGSSPDYMRRRLPNDSRDDDSDVSDSESGSDLKRRKTLTDGYPTLSVYRDGNPYLLSVPAVSGWAHCSTLQLESLLRPAQNVMDPTGFSFLEIANTLLKKSSETGIDAWGTILCMARMLLLAQGWSIPPRIEDAHLLLRDYESRYPGSNILALDPMTRSSKDMVILLSAEALKHLGPIARTQNGLERQLISTGDAWNALNTVFTAYKSPGIEFANNLTIFCIDGASRSVRCYFCMHPSQRILIVRADVI